MATETEKFIHQNTRTSHKRWESIVMYGLHFALRNVKLLSQYKVGPYLVDGYFPDVNVVVEIDEEHHDYQIEQDFVRENFIKNELNSEIYRVDVQKPVYQQIDEIISIVNSKNPPNWTIEKKERKVGAYSQNKRMELEAVCGFDFVDRLREELESLDIKVDTNHIGTPLTPANGEIGFMICFDGLILCMIVTKSLKPKLLITDYADNLVNLLSLELSEWINTTGNKYKVIENFKGQHSKDEVLDFIKKIKDRLY